MVRKVMMIAGEASGDLHGSGVVRALKDRVPGVEIFGIGGDNMAKEGMEILYHISGLSFMGFVEVLRNLRTIAALEKAMTAVLTSRRPDVVVLIDYPGFNLRFARRVKTLGIPVLYYISPQVWAWNKGRVRKMKNLVDMMKVVFPFEVEIYRKVGIDVEFVGHPVVERIGSALSRVDFFRKHRLDPTRKIIGLFPGSRPQEIEKIFPTMVEAAGELQRKYNVQVAVGVAPNLGLDALQRFIPEGSSVIPLEHATYDLMCHADAAIVTSGTATLETGWFGTPMVVVYRTSPITYFIGRLLVDVPYIGLVNIVVGKKVVPEFVQHAMSAGRLVEAVGNILRDDKYAASMRNELAVIKTRLGGSGASARVAEGIISLGRAA